MDHLNSQRIRSITNDRVEKFLSKVEWTDCNLYSALYTKRDSKSVHLKVYSITDIDPNETDRVSYKDAIKGEYKETKVGESFGPSWTTHWFKVDIKIPDGWEGHEIHFIWDSESEAMLWDNDQPQQLLNGSTGNDRRDFYILTDKAKPNDKWSFYIEMACNSMFGNPGQCGFLCPTDPNRYFKLKKAEIAIFSRKAWNLYRDLQIIYEISKELPKDDNRSWKAAEYCRKIVNATYIDNPDSFDEAQKIADEFLKAKNGDAVHKVTAVGHCHIDTAWLWPYSETRRKCARSWSTQCLLMDRYPDYKFAASQAQQFEWMKLKYPELYERIKGKVKSGNFIPIGGTWVEMDCNIPSGESFVRQFLIGQNYFKNEFGKICDIFWLPDTFGYSSQLPQIIKKSGCQYFLTQKLSWNNINKFPHSTFMWEGLDGTQVLSHFPPADTYISEANVKDLVFGINNFKTKDKSNESVMLFGWGDGGGGPNYDHIERLTRLRDVDGVPKVKLGHPVEYFRSVESNEHDLPVWSGELYFELHRGTYTTHARTKKGNRKCEFSLQMLEFVGTLSSILSSHTYPKDDLLKMWKLVLLNQFHDVLPGTSINLVYKDAEKYYCKVLEKSEKLSIEAIMSILKERKGKGGNVSVFNSLGWERKEIVEVPDTSDINGLTQKVNGKSLAIVSAPSLGFVTNVQLNGLNENTEPAKILQNDDGSVTLTNQYISCRFNKEGQMTSLFHKASNRESIAPNCVGNKFVLFEDIPLFWDAWDVEIYHSEKPVPMLGIEKLVEIKEKGPLRVSFEFTYRISKKSKIKQTVYLDALSEYPVFDTRVNWHESRKFLKVEFTWDIYSPLAYYSTHFGCISRPTHKNTTWDLARFEVCGHHWADLSEYGFGVALLNDCKYGYSCERNIMRLSLLRSSKHPDPEADMGEQSFKYATFPHKGNHTDSGLVRHGYNFNVPLKVIDHEEVQKSHFSSAWTDSPNIIIETLKKSENDKGYILRLWECYGGRGCAEVFISLPFKEIHYCNLIEEKIESVNIEIIEEGESKRIMVPYKPFEVITLFLKN